MSDLFVLWLIFNNILAHHHHFHVFVENLAQTFIHLFWLSISKQLSFFIFIGCQWYLDYFSCDNLRAGRHTAYRLASIRVYGQTHLLRNYTQRLNAVYGFVELILSLMFFFSNLLCLFYQHSYSYQYHLIKYFFLVFSF